MHKKIENLFSSVTKPARYTGGELNSVIKNKENVDIRFAFCFPDVYEVGMSHLGMKILYSLYNNVENIWCERVFLPAKDMEDAMRKNDVKLFSLESRDAIDTFDFVGFSLQYELSFTAILSMLDLAGIPLRSKERSGHHPIIIGGGPSVCNPEPVADFFDIFVIGEGEEVSLELFELYEKHKKPGYVKSKFLKEAATIEGIYVPCLYNVTYNSDGTVESYQNHGGAPKSVKKRIIADLNTVHYPDKFIVPFIDIVHDRAISEIFRGCIRGCRFCQAGFIYRPVREKSPETISNQSRVLCENTGYEEFSLASLSTSDYSEIEKLLPELLDWTIETKTNVSLPSLRIDGFSEDLVKKLNQMRKSGLTFAPEAGTQRLRDVINKNITEKDILETVQKAFSAGWTSVKLYFMLGLPTETLEDVEGIAKLGQKIVDVFYSLENRPKRAVVVSISAASFVPKPFTPFQWEPQDTKTILETKQQHLVKNNASKRVSIKYHDSDTSFLEAVFAKGDRRLGDVIEYAFKELGCGRDADFEFFTLAPWIQAFEKLNVSMDFYSGRKREYDEVFPWDHLDYGISKDFLIAEHKKALANQTTPHCREECSNCGASEWGVGVCFE